MKRIARRTAVVGVTLAALAIVALSAALPASAKFLQPPWPGAHLVVAPDGTNYWGSPEALIYNGTVIPAIGYARLWLNNSTGDVHAEIGSFRGEIQGSVIHLDVSGYDDFRNVIKTWPQTVAPGQSGANTPDVPYNVYGPYYWWRAVGYIGSGVGVTESYSFVYQGGGNWQYKCFVGGGFQCPPGTVGP